jgi:hypothetical protein
MAEMLFYLGDIAVVATSPGQVTHAAQAKKARLNQGADGRDLNINNRRSCLVLRFVDDKVYIRVAETLGIRTEPPLWPEESALA